MSTKTSLTGKPKPKKGSKNGVTPKPAQVSGGTPDCPHCGGMGFYMPAVESDHPDFGRAKVCSCRAAERKEEWSERLVTQSQLGHLREKTFDNFLPDGVALKDSKQLNLRLAFKHAKEFAENPEGWLLLKGGYGCGKTHLAAAIANLQLEKNKQVLFVSTPDLLDHLRASFRPSSATGYDERFEQIRNTPLLILDDLGSHSNTDWAQEKLYQIFNHRYNAKLPTVITTNEELEAIEIRVRSRLSDFTLVQNLHILAPDFRRGGEQDQSDLSSLHLHADKTFKNFSLREKELPRAQSTNLERAFESAKNFAQSPEGWLVFNSVGYGNGKTHLAAAIANEVSQAGQPVLFILVPDFLDYLRDTFSPNSSMSLGKRFSEVKTAPLLVLDDLGTESATAWAREKLYQLFNYRYNAKLPTIITTATPIEEIDPRLATRMLDGRCDFFVLEVPSYRVVRRKGRRK